jgi:hypothetical protein
MEADYEIDGDVEDNTMNDNSEIEISSSEYDV